LLDLVRQTALARFGQEGPGNRFAEWTRRLVLFHGKRHRAACRIMPIKSLATWFSRAIGFSCQVGEAA
jgi:hypothetical protein